MELIDNKYRVLRTLGKGGCGIVYVCWSEALSKEVAVKVLHDQMHSPVSLARFRNEAQSLSLCKHPCIVQCLTFGIAPDGHPYFVMDYVPGMSLSEELKQNGPLTPARFVNVFQDVLSALECAHAAGLVHRDLKPSNILLTNAFGNERAVLIDFGLTKQLEGQKLTATSALLGTPQYMSPEQCQGQQVDIRSDLYSIGCTMYEAATGNPPYQGEAMEILLSHLQAEPQGIPVVLKPLLDRLLAKDRTKRFSTATEASACLTDLDLRHSTKFEAGKDLAGKNSAGRSRRHTLLAPVLASIAMLCCALFCYYALVSYFAPGPDTKDPASSFAQALRLRQYEACKKQKDKYLSETDKSGQRAKNLLELAQLAASNNDLETALTTYGEAIEELKNYPKPYHDKLLLAISAKLDLEDKLGRTGPQSKVLNEWGIAFAHEWNRPIAERDLCLRQARRARAANQFSEAEKYYDKAAVICRQQKKVIDLADPGILLEEAALLTNRFLLEPSSQTEKKMLERTEAASILFQAARQKKQVAWQSEHQAAAMLCQSSKDPTVLKSLAERMKNAAQDQNLNYHERSRAQTTVAWAQNKAGDQKAATNLLKQILKRELGKGKLHRNDAAFAAYILLDNQLTTDPQKRIALTRLIYENYHPLSNDELEDFAMSASHLAIALQSAAHYEEAVPYFTEAAETSRKLAVQSRIDSKDPGISDRLYGRSIDNYVEVARCNICIGKHTAAEEARDTYHTLAKELTPNSSPTHILTIKSLDSQWPNQSAPPSH